MFCKCPAATALTYIPAVACSESFGQIQKVMFQRLVAGDNTLNTIDNDDCDVIATWNALIAAVDGTKIVVSPYIQAPTNEANSPRTFGGGNDTLGGIEIIVGREPSTFTAVMRGVPQSVIKVMKELECEAQAGNLGVYLIDENGKIEGIKVKSGASETYIWTPIPIRSLFISDKSHGGLEAPDSNNIQWAFPPNYSDDLAIMDINTFNALNLGN